MTEESPPDTAHVRLTMRPQAWMNITLVRQKLKQRVTQNAAIRRRRGARPSVSGTSPGPACGAVPRPGVRGREARRRGRGLWTQIARARVAPDVRQFRHPRDGLVTGQRPQRDLVIPVRPRGERAGQADYVRRAVRVPLRSRRSGVLQRSADRPGPAATAGDRQAARARRTSAGPRARLDPRRTGRPGSTARAWLRRGAAPSHPARTIQRARSFPAPWPRRSRRGRGGTGESRTRQAPARAASQPGSLPSPVTVTTRGSSATRHAAATMPSAGRTSSPVTRTS